MDATESIASAMQSLSVFPPVVHATQRERVGLVGASTVGSPFVDVIDVAELSRNVAAAVAAADSEQLCRCTYLAGEQSLRPTHVDDHVVRIDHDPADAAANHRSQDDVRVHRRASRGGAASRRRVDRIEVGSIAVIEFEQTVANERLDARGRVGDEVDQRLGSFTVGRCRDRSHEDLVHRVEPALVGAAGEGMSERLVTVGLATTRAILPELGVDRQVEDLLHLGGPQRVAAGSMNVDGPTVDGDRCRPVVLVEPLIVERTVGVGSSDEVCDRSGEVGVLEVFGVLREQRCELGESITGTRMPLCVGEEIDLTGTDVTRPQRVADLGMLVAEPRGA